MAATTVEHAYTPPGLQETAAPQTSRPTSGVPEVPHNPAIVNASSASIEAIKDVVFGSLAGICGKFVEYPFDTVKVRLQSHVSTATSPPYRGPVDCFVRSYRYDGGMSSLYRGISAPLFGAAIENSSLFFSYRVAQSAMVWANPSPREEGITQLPFSSLLLCGAASGAFTSILLTPIELVKCRMQVPAFASALGYKAPGPLTIIRDIFRHDGIRGFWHGQLGTLIRETGGSAAWFGSYEAVCNAFKRYSKTKVEENSQLPIHAQIVAGASAGMSYNFMFYPADTIKSRMQTEEHPTKTSATSSTTNTATRSTFASTGKLIWKKHGLRGFYRGCGITVARSAPSSALIFSVYEGLRGHFG